MYENNIEKIAVRVSVITIIFNALLTVFKFVAGFLGHSLAMVSDAIHSASDVMSTVIVIIGIKVSAKAADKDHEFGHERYECVAAILLAVLLFATGCGIGYSGVTAIIDGSYKTAQLPDYLAMSAAIVSIVVKEAMFCRSPAAYPLIFPVNHLVPHGQPNPIVLLYKGLNRHRLAETDHLEIIRLYGKHRT